MDSGLDNKEIVALIKQAFVSGFVDGFLCTDKEMNGKTIAPTSEPVQEILKHSWDINAEALAKEIMEAVK